MTTTTLNIIGLVSNIAGTVILAFSLNSYISSMRMAIDAHEIYIQSFTTSNSPVYVVTGTDVHMNKDKKNASLFSLLGISLVIIGFIFQLYSYLI